MRSTQALHSVQESWLVALPAVSWVEGDPSLASIKTLRLELKNKAQNRVAGFNCRLPRDEPKTGSKPRSTDVSSIERFCVGTFHGLS